MTNLGASAGSTEKPYSLKVVISEQKMYLYENAALVKTYPISTSKFGIGNREGSFKTPLGKKIGQDLPVNTILKDRKNTGKIALIKTNPEEHGEDVITSRILWLKGLEPGLNKGKNVDSFKRFIYIHGTASEGMIGRPASNGCIRMRNEDVIDLFERVQEKTPVLISE
jgi:lipoprotein-anchoring transpeptidase ErfK/SrfK